MAYSKLHSSLVNSSLWTQPDNVRILFITLLAICNWKGEVYGSRMGIERIANIAPDESDDIPNPWHVLMSPDSDSSDRLRNPENEGRRIEEIPGGFRIINYDYYRGIRNEDDRREQNRIAQDRHRKKVSQSQPRSARLIRVQPRSSHADADAEKERNKEKEQSQMHKQKQSSAVAADSSEGESLTEAQKDANRLRLAVKMRKLTDKLRLQ